MSSVSDRRQAADAFDFRALHDRLHFGTASDRFAGWIGTVYPERWTSEISTRTKKVGGQAFEERLLPIASVEDYFAHFSVLELDFTYYQPLLTEAGEPTSAYHTLRQYAEHAPNGARFWVKAPQQFASPILRRGKSFEENPEYLDPSGFQTRYLDPLHSLLGDMLAGIIFEQPYSRKKESPPPDVFASELDSFFRTTGPAPIHLEVRSSHLLVPAYFEMLERNSLGFVFSHWTWLPSLKTQWERSGSRFFRDRAVARLLNPRDVPFAKAFAWAYPFEEPAPELSQTPQARQLLDETTALAYQAIKHDVELSVITNNRAWGSSPHLAQAVAHRFLDFAERKGA